MSLSVSSFSKLQTAHSPDIESILSPQKKSQLEGMIQSLADSYQQVDSLIAKDSVTPGQMIQAQKDLSLLHFRLSLIAKSVDAVSSLSRRLQHG